jgi:CO/xanthine dehydrogenase Mo-binding subunit
VLNANQFTATALLTNKTPAGTYRAPGRYEASFFCERLIELAAVDLAIDSAEIRRRNLISAAEMPYKLPRSTQVRSPALAASATFVGSTNRSMSPSDEAEVAFVSPCALRV